MGQEKVEVKKNLASKSLYLLKNQREEREVALMAVLADRDVRGIAGQSRTNP
jgi:hypothetical protein